MSTQVRFRNFPIRRAIMFSLFVAAQLLLVAWYLQQLDFFGQISAEVVMQSYIPSWQHALTGTKVPVASTMATSVPVLIYHGVVDKADGANVLISDFRDQMFTLYKAGWKAVSLEDFEAYMDGKKMLPNKSFLITFDDGRKDSYYPVDPILETLDYKATMFVITKHVEHNNRSPYYLNRNEILHMAHNGRWSIQSHTQNGHDLMDVAADGMKGDFYSNLLWLKDKKRLETQAEFRARVHNDLVGAKTDITSEVGIAPTTFAFPFGDYGQETINNPQAEAYVLAQTKQLYKYAFAQEQVNSASFGHNMPGQNLLNLQRIKVYPGWTGANLSKIMTIGGSKQLPYTSNFADVEGWAPLYGDLSLDGSSGLRIAPNKDGTGAGAVLEGTQGFSNIDYSLTLKWQAGSSLALVARYKDAKNYLACNFGPTATTIQQLTQGKPATIGQSGPGIARSPSVTLQMKTSGARVSCWAGSKQLATSDDITYLDAGSIGIKIWDGLPNTSLVYLTNVSLQ